MSANRYGNFLTILLVIIIIIVIIAVAFIIYNATKSKDDIEEAIASFNKVVQEQEEEQEKEEDGDPVDIEGIEVTPGGNGNTTQSKKQYYNGYVMIGYIEINKTGIKYPILEKGTDKALEVSVAVMYPEDAASKLNQPGNVVIMGHNYRNGKFFSNNKKLVTGDKIKITSYSGTKTYTIYEIFETTPGDTSFISRNTEGATEISLSTCTDDGARRLIILARAN